VEIRHQFRFVSTSGTATPISALTLAGSAGTVGIAINSAVVAIAGSIKLNRVDIWSPPASQGAAVTCSVDWVGYANSPNREVSDTSVSVTTPAKVSCSPPPMSLAAFWQTVTTTTALCTITAPPGSIIDIYLAYILNDDDETGAVITVATATFGAFYFLAADGPATNRYTPVSLTTTH